MHPQRHISAVLTAFLACSEATLAEEPNPLDGLSGGLELLERGGIDSPGLKILGKGAEALSEIDNISASNKTLRDKFWSGQQATHTDFLPYYKLFLKATPLSPAVQAYETANFILNSYPVVIEELQDRGLVQRSGPQWYDDFDNLQRHEIKAREGQEKAYWKQMQEDLERRKALHAGCGSKEWYDSIDGVCKPENEDRKEKERSSGWRIKQHHFNGNSVAENGECTLKNVESIQDLTVIFVEDFVKGAGYEVVSISYNGDKESDTELTLKGNYHLFLKILFDGSKAVITRNHVYKGTNVEEKQVWEKC